MGADPRQSLGKMGEDLACHELQQRGYDILSRRYRTRHGEIDIIARDGGAIVFVEVKTRHDQAFGGAAAAVTALKRHRVVRMATDFLARHGWLEAECRFDVVTIYIRGGEPRIEIIRHAFTA